MSKQTIAFTKLLSQQEEYERAKAEAIFASIGDGAVTTDEVGRIQRINQVALDLMGFSEDEVVGKWFPKIFVAKDKKGNTTSALDRPITQAFLTSRPVNAQTYYVKKDGSLLPVSLTVSPLLFRGKPIGAMEVFRDITHELEVDRMKSEFISIASHQLRTPLSAIGTYTHMLHDGLRGELTPEQKDYLQVVLNSVKRMNELIDTLLDVTRLEAGKIVVRPEETQLDELLDILRIELEPIANRKNLNFNIKAEPITALVDPFLVKEVFANLISNAIKYTPQKGTVKVKLSLDKNRIKFSVKDTGYGMPDDVQHKIFSKFYRGHNIQQQTEGTGLGLYMVNEIAKILEGKLTFHSIENKGTTFYFSLPYLSAGDP